jgi:putative MATE family efflux protein
MTLAAILFRRPAINLIYGNIEQRVLDSASTYFFITALSYPFLAVFSANAALFRSVGNSRVTMLVALLVNILNIGGNAFFIYVMKIGVTGAAISTLISRIIAAIVTTLLLTHRGGYISLNGLFHKPKIARSMIRNILNIGIPSGLENSLFMLGKLFTQRIFSVFGTAAIAANAVAGVVDSFSSMPGMAFGLALITIVGQCVGAGDDEAAAKQTAKIIKIVYVMIIISRVIMFIYLENLVGIFSLSKEAHDLAVSFLKLYFISSVIAWGYSWILPNALRAAGDAKFVMIAAIIIMWIVRISASYLLSFVFKLGPMGVWLAMGIDMFVRGTIFTLRWYRGKWKGKTVI